jgi:carbamoyl-phosphate synthase large subunit
MINPFNVLISSAGRRVGLLEIFRSTLHDLGLSGRVLAADMSPLSSAYQRADAGFQVPPVGDPTFPDAIEQICVVHGVRLVVPTTDRELSVYAAHRERFAAHGIVVAVSAPEVITICEDKAATAAWLAENRIPAPSTTPAGTGSHRDGWTYPVVVKPRRGSASIGVAVVEDPAALQGATRNGDFVVQPLLRGPEFTVDVLVDRGGRAVCAVPRERLEIRSGESSKGVTRRSFELEQLATKVCEALPGAYGAVTVQMMVDEGTGAAQVIEMNPRFGGGFPLAWQAGAAYPRWMIEEILGLPSSARADGWRDGVVMLRYDEAVFVERAEAGI